MSGGEIKVIKVGTLAKMRRLHLREGVPIKEIERRTGPARNTIKARLAKDEMVEPQYPKSVPITKLDAFVPTLSTWLKANMHRSKHERRTRLAMHQELVTQGYAGSYGRVTLFARRWRKSQLGSEGKGAFVPLKFALGEAFQIAWIAEYASIGGVPQRGIDDNLKVAVDKVGAGKRRVVNSRFEAMTGHYLFEPEFCDVANGWPKGIVEKNVRDRRTRIWVKALG